MQQRMRPHSQACSVIDEGATLPSHGPPVCQPVRGRRWVPQGGAIDGRVGLTCATGGYRQAASASVRPVAV